MPVGLRCLLVWLLLAPPACGAGVQELTLGFIGPPSEPDATSLLRGVQLAVAEANGTGEAPVRLEVRSGSGQWGTVGNEAVILVCNRHVDAIIAPSDGAATHLVLQVSGRTRVPVASLCSDSSVTDAGVPWAVRVVPRTDQEAEALFIAVRRPDGRSFRWWAVIPAGRPGNAIRRDLEKAARGTATQLERIEDGSEPGTDPAPLVQAIVAATPEEVLLWLPPSRAGTLVAALRAAGYGGSLAGPAPLDSPDFLAAAGPAATGVLVTAFRAEADGRARAEKFARQFRQEFGAGPDFSAAAAHDAAQVLIAALRHRGNAAAYRQFPLVRPTAGVTGPLNFDKFGNRTDALQVLTCRQGCFLPIPSYDTKP